MSMKESALDVIGIIITATLSLAALLGFGSFLAIRIMRISMKLSEDYENKAQIEDMKKQHAAQLEDLRNQVARLTDAVIGTKASLELQDKEKRSKDE